jgi:benzoate-CoA ligase
MLVAADMYARETIGLRESDVSFSVAKLFFAYGLGNGLYFPLRTGGTTVLLPDRPLPEKVFATIDRYQPTVFYGVPTSYAALLHAAEKAGRTNLGRVRMCVSAGETLPRHIFQRWRDRFGVEILDGIGSTEILHIFISNRPGQAKAGSTGQIVPGYEAKIVDDAGVEVPVGQVGTLLMKGDSIALGYWNQHEATKRTFSGEWIDTHDKFMVDQDGYFWYSGRADDMLKVSGQAVWPAEVEGLLQEHPAVLESGVTGAADEQGLLKPVAFVVLKDGHPPSPQLAREIQDFVKKNTSPHKYPRAVVFVESLPKTANGKIKRFELRHRAAVDGVLRNGEAPKSQVPSPFGRGLG